jgi:hypothetical protein
MIIYYSKFHSLKIFVQTESQKTKNYLSSKLCSEMSSIYTLYLPNKIPTRYIASFVNKFNMIFFSQ